MFLLSNTIIWVCINLPGSHATLENNNCLNYFHDIHPMHVTKKVIQWSNPFVCVWKEEIASRKVKLTSVNLEFSSNPRVIRALPSLLEKNFLGICKDDRVHWPLVNDRSCHKPVAYVYTVLRSCMFSSQASSYMRRCIFMSKSFYSPSVALSIIEYRRS